MILSYNLSPKIKDLILDIEKLRTDLLLLSIPPKTEIRLKWESEIGRIYWSHSLGNGNLPKSRIGRLIAYPANGMLTNEEKAVVNYKAGLNLIKQEWLVNNRQISVNVLLELFNLACRPSFNSANISLKSKKELNNLFEYLHKGGDHPVIQAGIAQISLIEIAPFERGNDIIARLIPYLYLYKNGYDFRGLLVIDEYLRRDMVELNFAVTTSQKKQNLTFWLEYFLTGISVQLKNAIAIVGESKFTTEVSNIFFKLNVRQKTIYEMFEEPDIKISNRTVQDRFKVSQITSSRDLAKLVGLNLIFSFGKGRSTFYMKA